MVQRPPLGSTPGNSRVASSFSHKPYIFNRSNLERYSGGRYCTACPLRDRGCPFEASYEELDSRLFQR